MISRIAVLVLLAWGAAAASQTVVPSPRDDDCLEWRDCRQRALAAADRREYETFHDLAWRAVQTGPPRDPALMYLLARAQSLSGRPHDALVMLDRLAEMGVASDAATDDDFSRTRQLPGWPELVARIERIRHPAPPPAVAVATAGSSPLSASVAGDPLSVSTLPRPAEAVRFSTERSAVTGLAYDAVSHRFVFGDRVGRKLVVVAEGSNHVVDFVRADSTGFDEISAIEIDAKRGDLWVTSTRADEGAGTLHRLQLVSGRPLRAFRVAADLEPVRLVDLSVSPAGVVFVLDSASGQVLVLRSGGTAVERVVRIDAEEPASLAIWSDEGIAYVAHRDGVSRIDLRARTVTPVSAPKAVSLAGFERIRRYRNQLIAIGVGVDGSRRIIRLELNASGRAVTRATTLEAGVPKDGQAFVTISGDELVYLVGDPNPGRGRSPANTSSGVVEFVAYRVRLH